MEAQALEVHLKYPLRNRLADTTVEAVTQQPQVRTLEKPLLHKGKWDMGFLKAPPEVKLHAGSSPGQARCLCR